MAYQSNLLGDFWQSYRQKRLGGGRISRREAGNLLGPMLEYDARKAEEAGRRAQDQARIDRDFGLREKAQETQDLTSAVGGVGQLATLPLAYKSAKDLGWIGGAKTATNANLLGGTAQMSVAPGAASTTAQAGTLSGAAFPGVAGGTAAPGAVGPMSAVTADAGLLSTAGTAAGPAGLAGAVGALGGNLLGGAISRATGLHEKTAKDIGGVLGGAGAGVLAGAAATSWSGPGAVIGGLIGGAIGAVSALF